MSSATAARPTLLPLAAFVSLLVLLLGATGLFALHQTDVKAARDRETYRRTNEVLLTALEARANFKTQVQEWKNILLRGHTAEDLALYRARFETESDTVAADLHRLAEAYTATHQDQTDAHDIAALVTAHDALGVAYRAALASFDPARPEAARATDTLVRGIDRDLAERLDLVAASMARENAVALEQMSLAAAARYAALRRVTWIVAGLAVLAALWLCFRATRLAAA